MSQEKRIKNLSSSKSSTENSDAVTVSDTRVTPDTDNSKSFTKKLIKEDLSKKDENWLLFDHEKLGSVYIHKLLYNTLGIIAFKGMYVSPHLLVGPDYFSFNTRTLKFSDDSKKNSDLIKQFQNYIDEKSPSISTETTLLTSSTSTSSFVPTPLAKASDGAINTTVIFNPKRRDEIFYPLRIRQENEDESWGLHIYPWLSKGKEKFAFAGFKDFVTALCMFGSSLKGIDQKGGEFPIIKHGLDFFDGQKITEIKFEQPSFYETMQFKAFEKLAHLIKSLSSSDTDSKPRLFCHLPYYDYILVCFNLFVSDKMTQEALESAIQGILEKKDDYVLQIKEICSEYSIQVSIFSPFDNIFGRLSDYETIKEILKKLQRTENKQACNEKYIVQNCLDLLITKNLQESHHQVWEHFIQLKGKENIHTLEELFKIGNAFVVGTVSYKKPDYQVCSLLPLSEKQIQTSYQEFSKKQPSIYSGVVNISYLDFCLGYGFINRGNAFYFNDCQSILNELISYELLESAYKNAATKPGKKNHQPLEMFLQKFKNKIAIEECLSLMINTPRNEPESDFMKQILNNDILKKLSADTLTILIATLELWVAKDKKIEETPNDAGTLSTTSFFLPSSSPAIPASTSTESKLSPRNKEVSSATVGAQTFFAAKKPDKKPDSKKMKEIISPDERNKPEFQNS